MLARLRGRWGREKMHAQAADPVDQEDPGSLSRNSTEAVQLALQFASNCLTARSELGRELAEC